MTPLTNLILIWFVVLLAIICTRACDRWPRRRNRRLNPRRGGWLINNLRDMGRLR